MFTKENFTNTFIGFWSIFGALFIIATVFLPIPKDNVRFADTAQGFVLGTIITTVVTYVIGSSASSKKKDETIAGSLNQSNDDPAKTKS